MQQISRENSSWISSQVTKTDSIHRFIHKFGSYSRRNESKESIYFQIKEEKCPKGEHKKKMKVAVIHKEMLTVYTAYLSWLTLYIWSTFYCLLYLTSVQQKLMPSSEKHFGKKSTINLLHLHLVAWRKLIIRLFCTLFPLFPRVQFGGICVWMCEGEGECELPTEQMCQVTVLMFWI